MSNNPSVHAGTEMMDGQLMGEFEVEAKELEADSWSLGVEQQYLQQLDRELVKRQDVIYGRTGTDWLVPETLCGYKHQRSVSFRADADGDASHSDAAHHVRGLQQRSAEGAAAGAADSGEAVSSSGRSPGPAHATPPPPAGEEEGEPAGSRQCGWRHHHQQDRRPPVEPGQSDDQNHEIFRIILEKRASAWQSLTYPSPDIRGEASSKDSRCFLELRVHG